MTKPLLTLLILLSFFTKILAHTGPGANKSVAKDKAKEDKTDNQPVAYQRAAKKKMSIPTSQVLEQQGLINAQTLDC